MTQKWWQQACKQANEEWRQKAILRQRSLTKPFGSLGQLETLAIDIAALQGTARPEVSSVWISLFAGDHGVTAEGISAFPQVVTVEMMRNFVRGGAAVSVMAKAIDARLEVVNMGTATPSDGLTGVLDRRIAPGTANFVETEAMTAAQCEAALAVGKERAEAALAQKSTLFIGGEMGIGNTTSAAALACLLLDAPTIDLVGPGTGLDEQGIRRKADVIERARRRHATTDAFDVLSRVGGLEIAALTGAYLRCAQIGIVVLIDGFICSTAALLAVRLNPACRDWFIFAHRGAEPGHRAVLAALRAEPLIELGLCLGEGSGAALAVPLLQQACRLHNEMATFAEAAVSDNRS